MSDDMANADKSASASPTSGGMRPESRQVYDGFLGITKWAVILIALVLIAMAIFLV